MKLDAYVSQSRHGIYYFRWPLPVADSAPRATIRLSLGVRCPKQAGEIARYLASFGRTLGADGALSRMRYDELRETVHAIFKSRLEGYQKRVAQNGPHIRDRAATQGSLEWAEGPSADYWDVHAQKGTEAFLSDFFASHGIPLEEVNINPNRWLEEIKNAHRDMLRAMLDYQARLTSYDYLEQTSDPRPQFAQDKPVERGISLQQAIDEYINENRRAKTWEIRTFDKKLATLAVLTEVLGAAKPLRAVTDEDAQNVKRLLQGLPVNRNKLPQTKGLSIQESVDVVGLAKISTVTVNGYLSMFQSFFDWAVKNRHIRENLFAGMKVGKSGKTGQPQRQAFKASALKAVYCELTENRLGLVKSESHKWASLIGIFSGARLNEICQLESADIREVDGIWYFNLTEEGETTKRLKSLSANRKVPIHKELLRLGLLDYHKSIIGLSSKRLFPDYSFSPRDGYGRALGRWFNDQLTLNLGIKSKNHVFHGLRHTMITWLGQADVPEPIIQSIVGHAKKGVTQQTYNRKGYKLRQLKDAIDLFNISPT